MHYDGLKVFQKINELKSFRKAAVAMGLSQPRLSYAIARLEEELRAQLFERSSRGIILTEAGKIFAEKVNSLIALWEDVTLNLADTKREQRWQLSLGAHPEVASYSFPLFLPTLLEKYASMQLKIHHGLSREVQAMVVDHQIDLAIVINPLDNADLIIKDLATDEVSLFCSPKNRNYRTLFFDPNLAQSQWILRKIGPLGFTRLIECSNLSVIRSLCASGAGVGILPARVAGDLVRIESNAPKFSDRLALVYRSTFRHRPFAQDLIKQIRSAFAPQYQTSAAGFVLPNERKQNLDIYKDQL